MERVRNIQIIVNLLTWILVLLSTGLFVFRVFTAFPFSNTSRLFDFGWYEYAFNVVWNHMAPSSMYQRSSELRWIHQYLQGTPWHLNGGSQFLYPPQFAVLFSWVAALPIHTANVVWDAILTLCYIGAVTLLVLMIRGDNNNNRSSISLTLLLVAISLSWQPFQTDIYWGNSDSLLFFLVILTFYLKDYRQRPILAGIALGLAVLFKVTPALLLIFFLVKHPRTSISTFVTMTIGTIISWIVVGWKPIIYYVLHFGTMAHRSAVLNGNGGAAPWNSSIQGVLELLRYKGLYWITPTLIDIIFALLVLTVLVLLGLRIFSRHVPSKRTEAEIGILILSLILFSPVIESHYIILALAPYLFTVNNLVISWHTLSSTRRNVAVAAMLSAWVLINPIGGAMIRFYTQMVPVHYFLGIVVISIFQFFPINLSLLKRPLRHIR